MLPKLGAIGSLTAGASATVLVQRSSAHELVEEKNQKLDLEGLAAAWGWQLGPD